eukprot:scaffold1320_cov326-Prasinococcus_capsulatus_cf.AAC.9
MQLLSAGSGRSPPIAGSQLAADSAADSCRTAAAAAKAAARACGALSTGSVAMARQCSRYGPRCRSSRAQCCRCGSTPLSSSSQPSRRYIAATPSAQSPRLRASRRGRAVGGAPGAQVLLSHAGAELVQHPAGARAVRGARGVVLVGEGEQLDGLVRVLHVRLPRQQEARQLLRRQALLLGGGASAQQQRRPAQVEWQAHVLRAARQDHIARLQRVARRARRFFKSPAPPRREARRRRVVEARVLLPRRRRQGRGRGRRRRAANRAGVARGVLALRVARQHGGEPLVRPGHPRPVQEAQRRGALQVQPLVEVAVPPHQRRGVCQLAARHAQLQHAAEQVLGDLLQLQQPRPRGHVVGGGDRRVARDEQLPRKLVGVAQVLERGGRVLLEHGAGGRLVAVLDAGAQALHLRRAVTE